MSRVAFILLIVSALVVLAAPPLPVADVVVNTIVLNERDANTNTTIIVQVSTNLANPDGWLTLTNFPATGVTNQIRIPAAGEGQYFRTVLSNLLSVSEPSEPSYQPPRLVGGHIQFLSKAAKE